MKKKFYAPGSPAASRAMTRASKESRLSRLILQPRLDALQAKDRKLESIATEIRLRAERPRRQRAVPRELPKAKPRGGI
jgi:hypothetical protein